MCDQCGDEVAYKDLRKQWDGLFTCGTCFDTRHPQDFPRASGADPEALLNPRVDNNDADSSIYVEVDNQWEIDNP